MSYGEVESDDRGKVKLNIRKISNSYDEQVSDELLSVSSKSSSASWLLPEDVFQSLVDLLENSLREGCYDTAVTVISVFNNLILHECLRESIIERIGFKSSYILCLETCTDPLVMRTCFRGMNLIVRYGFSSILIDEYIVIRYSIALIATNSLDPELLCQMIEFCQAILDKILPPYKDANIELYSRLNDSDLPFVDMCVGMLSDRDTAEALIDGKVVNLTISVINDICQLVINNVVQLSVSDSQNMFDKVNECVRVLVVDLASIYSYKEKLILMDVFRDLHSFFTSKTDINVLTTEDLVVVEELYEVLTEAILRRNADDVDIVSFRLTTLSPTNTIVPNKQLSRAVTSAKGLITFIDTISEENSLKWLRKQAIKVPSLESLLQVISLSSSLHSDTARGVLASIVKEQL